MCIKQLLPPILLACLLPVRGHAEDASDPCAALLKQALDATGTPAYGDASKALSACEDQRVAQQKAEYVRTAKTWAEGFDLLGGGWKLLDVTTDGATAIFGSHRHDSRKGNVVAVWLRYEYRNSHSQNGESFKSLVERSLYDCDRIASKEISQTAYPENNLEGVPVLSSTLDEGKVTWTPVIPGTLGDELLDWACKTTPATVPTKQK